MFLDNHTIKYVDNDIHSHLLFFIKDCHNLVTNASYTAKVKFEDDYPVMIPLKPV